MLHGWQAHGGAELRRDPELRAFKSKAFRHLGRLEEAAECLVEICRRDNKEHVLEAGQVVDGIIERFEQFEAGSADAARLRKNVLALARYCERISLTSYGLMPVDTARLYVAESLLLGEEKKAEEAEKKVAELEDFLDKTKQNLQIVEDAKTKSDKEAEAKAKALAEREDSW